MRRFGQVVCAASLVAAAVLLSGCAGLSFGGSSAEGPCLDDSQACIAQRTQIVQSLTEDQSRAWVGQTAGRGMVASGVRLFAYQNMRDKLTCPELSGAIAELDAAKQTLAEGPAPGQTMLRHNQIAAMTTDVRAELVVARSRKCGVASR